MKSALVLAGLASLGLASLARACTTRTPPVAQERDAAPSDPAVLLRPFEEATRGSLNFEQPPSAETGLGADPWAVRRVPSGWVGILRGRSAIVLLDDELKELARLPAPRSPTGLALGKNGEILVVGELSTHVARYAVRGHVLEALSEVEVPGVMGLRDVAVSPAGVVWALDERGGRALRLALDGKPVVVASLPVGHGAVQLLATAKHLVVDAVTDHTLLVFGADASGVRAGRAPQRITHDGPMWGFDARETANGLVVAAGGVEDHPLDRRSGFFGYIDSFVFAYRVHDASFETLAVLNVSEHGTVTPKAISIDVPAGADAARVDLLVGGYGSASGLRIGLHGADAPTIAPIALVPGIRAFESADRSSATPAMAMADPLLDAWVLSDAHGVRVVPVEDRGEVPARTTASRLGEALFFTSLMAPKNKSEGASSRFTCETCHFEGYVDGRTHHTGRDEIHATTKPLVGLVGNRPYFSRALDPDLSSVSDAEFRVAGAGSGTDPYFAVDPHEHGNEWLAHLGVRELVEPLELRRSLLRFLVDFSHRPNAAVVNRVNRANRAPAQGASFDAVERDGARLFRERCESCHAARLSADDPATYIAFERWEAMVLSESAPIVWGSAGYQKTGVLPYVNDEGARTPSLRRLAKKHPYFTNGSATSIDDVLDGVRFTATRTFHAGHRDGTTALPDEEKRSLRAFLDLL
ncbi:MAG: cytochrome c peroxidase [Myxococcales bacterium]|nr:cytochrome c peroxidase [Myxococcales bacterium]